MFPEIPVAEDDAPEAVLESCVPFVDSLLWRLQRRFYAERGPGAWERGAVPYHITSNPYIARTYARIALAFLRDCAAGAAGGPPVEPDARIDIIELGSGSGRFAYLFLKKLLALKDASSLRRLRVRYVMTDFTETNVQAWRAHPGLARLADAGVLDFAVFDAERDLTIRLERSGEVLSAETPRGPTLVIANYVFDTLRQELLRIEQGRMSRGLITTTAKAPVDLALAPPEIMADLGFRFDYEPIASLPGSDADLGFIAEAYRERLGDTTVLLPVGPIHALRALLSIAAGRLLLLSSDKGHAHEDELLEQEHPDLVFHGSLSVMVNFHALGLYARRCGGDAIASPQRHVGLTTAALFFGGGSFEEARLAFAEEVESFGPGDFYRLVTGLREECPSPSIEHIVTALRLSDWDPMVFGRFMQELIEKTASAQRPVQEELRFALQRVWECASSPETDVAFDIACVLLELKRPREALRYYELSRAAFGDHPLTLYNIGVCHYLGEQPEEALSWFERALELEPGHTAALAWRVRAQAEIARRAR